jgi:hypothetical protein
MNQSELTKEKQKCHHDFFMGSTCEWCIIENLKARNIQLETFVERLVAKNYVSGWVLADAKDLLKKAK